MLKKSNLIAILFMFCCTMAYASNYDDIKLLKSSAKEEIYEISISDFEISEGSKIENEKVETVSFKYGHELPTSNNYNLPFRVLKFAVPKNGSINVNVISKSDKSFNNVNLLQKKDYELSDNNIDEFISVSKKRRFRDLMIQEVIINPLSYNFPAKSLKFTQKLKIRVRYLGNSNVSASYKARGKLDVLYKKMLLNFEKGKNWQIAKTRNLSKSKTMGIGTFYGFSISEDGLYKITASTLNNSGINIDVLSLNSLELYNNGGHKLSLATASEQWNPPFSQEIAIFINDQNNNNLFDANDYLLFYGKSLNGWFYDSASKSFTHQKHPYDTKNTYYLSVDGTNGKRMVNAPLAAIGGAIEQTHFIEHFHYEEDKFNLLNSGPDWYGHRFFGRSATHTINFDLSPLTNSNVKPEMKVRLKGGTNILYSASSRPSSKYYFDFVLNSTSALKDTFTNFSVKTKTRELESNSILKEGNNTLQINYLANRDESNANLDYFHIKYAKALQAVNNKISIFHNSNGTNKKYSVNGFSNLNDIYIFDVTDPINVKLLSENKSSSSGELNFDIPAEWESKNIVIASLGSSNIQTVSSLSPYNVNSNLLDPGKSADYVIITRKSLMNYGQEIADLRDHLKTEVVSVEDIFFYFNSGVQDPTAIRNFIRHAYYNWQTPNLSYVLLLGDGHFDYRNITLNDSSVVPTYQIYGTQELTSRESDMFYTQLEKQTNSTNSIYPSIAIGRLPVENELDAARMVEKLKIYDQNPLKDGWQTNITFIADDDITRTEHSSAELAHQWQAERLATMLELDRFIINRIYISGYPAIPGGRSRLMPTATQALIDQINRGTLILNYTGHGSPTQWAHETVFNFDRDYSKINNDAKLPFIIAATCDFGLFDNPNHVSFTEALIWKEKSGTIGTVAPTRLVYSSPNFFFNERFYQNLFPEGSPSVPLGEAFIQSISTSSSNTNDQKYHLLADPAMTLADAREDIEITSISPDTLKALSKVEVKAKIKISDQYAADFDGGAVMLVQDAVFEDINTQGGSGDNYDLQGPLVFRGEISVSEGNMEGNFIIPKSIRYAATNTGRLTFYAWDENTNLTATGFRKDLLLLGSSSLAKESDGPEIDIFFEGQENFTSGDIIASNPILIAELDDESGINLTGQLGHKIELIIDGTQTLDISESFSYERDSFTKGSIHYPITDLEPGEHVLTLKAFDNLNNLTEKSIEFKITTSNDLVLDEVVNYPNPFKRRTDFTFQTNKPGAEATIKIYTLSGRLIEKLDGYFSKAGYNEIEWNGLDRDGNTLANGVYLYKIVLKDGKDKKEKIEKMIVLK